MGDELRLSEDLHLDSLGRVQLSAAIEERLGIVEGSGLLEEVQTLGELRRLVAGAEGPKGRDLGTKGLGTRDIGTRDSENEGPGTGNREQNLRCADCGARRAMFIPSGRGGRRSDGCAWLSLKRFSAR